MATTKTAKPAKTARTTATKRATPVNGGKPAATKKTATAKLPTGRKKLEEMTDEEIGLLAWETSYKNRHKRLDQ